MDETRTISNVMSENRKDNTPAPALSASGNDTAGGKPESGAPEDVHGTVDPTGPAPEGEAADPDGSQKTVHHDRIAEAYEGSMGERFQLRLQERVNWICEKAGGGEILDIGCSQGTCPLLLGRGGAEVTGIDIDPEAIRYATAQLLTEPVEVQSRVRYLCADFLAVELPENHFDAVLMTEVLEHLEDPQSFLDKAVSLLRDGGRMVITVPFGINAHPDHKRTYYLAELYGQLSERMTIADIEFFSGWIGFLAFRNTSSVPAIETDLQLIAREEASFHEMEQMLRTDLQKAREDRQRYKDRALDLSEKLKERKEAETALKTRAEQLKTDLTERAAAAKAEETKWRAALADRDAEAKAAESKWQAALADRDAEAKAAESKWQAALANKDAAAKAEEEKWRTALDEKDAVLADRDAALAEKDAVLADRDAAAKAAEEKWQAALDEKDAALADRDAAAKAAEAELQAALGGCREQLQSTAADLEAVQEELKKQNDALRTSKETVQNQNSELKDTRERLKTALNKLKKTEDNLSDRERSLKESRDKLTLTEKREAQQREKAVQLNRELGQTKRKLESSDAERADLRNKLDQSEQAYHELLDTPAGHRAHIKLLKQKFRSKRRAERADRRAHKGSLLRRIAKRIPFLVRIVKKIRMRNPEAEFLFLKASRSDYVSSTAPKIPARSSAVSAQRKPALPDQPLQKPAAQEQPVQKPAVQEQPEKKTEAPVPEPQKDQAIAAEPAPKRKAPKPEKQPDTRVMTAEQEHFVDSLLSKLNALPESNGSRYYQKSDLRIGILCDEFFLDSINAAADFVPLTPADWREKLPTVDLLLVVTLWRGLHEEWRGVANVAHPDMEKINAIFDMIAEAKGLGMPTVFFSKEDPPNYSVFIEFAKRCDYIFTTAEECLPDYVRDTGNPEPKVLRFSVNPLFHNPVGFRKFEKEKTVVFSGSWMEKYPDRCKDMSMLFDGVLASGYGLHIIDRNYPSNRKYLFPHAYFPYVSPAVDHATLQRIHKLYDWAINTNSVQFSKTMFANRAYELQATGALLLSNYSLGVNRLLPNVFMAFSSEEARAILDTYTPEEIYERQISGIRSVMRQDTCFDRMDELFEAVGLERQQKLRRIAVIGNPEDPAVTDSFARQTFPSRALLAPDAVTDAVLEDFDMVAFFGDGMYYGEFYLEDMAYGFKYTDCDYITKDAYFEQGQLREGVEHDYVTVVGSRYRTVFWRETFDAQMLLTMQDGTQLANGYSIDHFNYDVSPAAVKRDRTEPYKLSVVVPAYNNGPHLYGKCFSSLRRSSLFPDLEIILVDYGSTDGVTPKYITYLESRYPNVRSFFFTEGDGGTAARARMKGAELAQAGFVSFLDPENEATEDGLAKLLESMENGAYQAVLGDYLLVGTEICRVEQHATAQEKLGTDRTAESSPELQQLLRVPELNIQTSVLPRALVQKERVPQDADTAGDGADENPFRDVKTVRFIPVSVLVDYRIQDGTAAAP